VFLWHSELLPQAILLNKLKGLYYKMSLLITLGDTTIYLLQTTQATSKTHLMLPLPFLCPSQNWTTSVPHFYFPQLHFDKLFLPAVCSSSNQNLYGYFECFISLLKFPLLNHCMHVAEKCWYRYPFVIILKLNDHVLDP
jgi:hypothetical protein